MAPLAIPHWEAVTLEARDLLAVKWDQVKAFFVAQARRLGQKWFGQDY